MKNAALSLLTCLICTLTTTNILAANVNKGREVYDKNCQICHGADGKGVVADAPDFSFGEELMKQDTELFNAISLGKGMSPAYRGILSEEEIFDVISYLRMLQR